MGKQTKGGISKPVTAAQIKGLQTLFSKMGMSEEDRHDFISGFTDGRTSSTKELTMDEATLMFARLRGESERQQAIADTQYEQRRRVVGQIYFLSLQISFLNRSYPGDDENERRMNYAKISRWTREKHPIHKPVNEMDLQELLIVKRQLEAIARKENN